MACKIKRPPIPQHQLQLYPLPDVPPRLLQLRPPSLLSLLLLVPQKSPQDLAASALGHNIDELHAALNPLVSRLMLLNVLTYGRDDILIGLAVAIRLLDDECLGHLARLLVGDLDDRTVGDVAVREEVGFEFGGSDLVALQCTSLARFGYAREALIEAR